MTDHRGGQPMGDTVADCIFCKIVRGELPSKVIYEDDRVLAFDDVSPQAPIHTLIIPKRHYVSLNDDIEPEDLAALFGAVQHVARMKGVSESGYRTIVNSGPDSNQTVKHLHVHVMGGKRMTHGMVDFSAD